MRQYKRIRVWKKYHKRCAYCGKKLAYKQMQVDHFYPKSAGGSSNYNNLMPSCPRCNHYKRARKLEEFRQLMKNLHNKIKKGYLNKIAMDYGLIHVQPFNGKFYFEKTGRRKRIKKRR